MEVLIITLLLAHTCVDIFIIVTIKFQNFQVIENMTIALIGRRVNNVHRPTPYLIRVMLNETFS